MGTVDAPLRDLMRTELAGDEGDKLKVYDDATGKPLVKGMTLKGNPTIGRGRNLAGNGITEAESLYLCDNDIDCAYADLDAALPWFAALTDSRKVALMSLYFNMDLHSVGKFLAGWPNLLQQCEAGQFEQAADNLESSEPWATEVGARAHRLGEMLRYG